MIHECFVFIRGVVRFFQIKTCHNTQKIHSFTKGSIALLIESLRENKFLDLKFEEIKSKLLVSIQGWLLLRRSTKKSRRSVRFCKSGSKKKNMKVSSAKCTHKTSCIVCFV